MNTLRRLFLSNKATKDIFRDNGGFMAIVTILMGMENKFVKKETTTTEKERRDSNPTQQRPTTPTPTTTAIIPSPRRSTSPIPIEILEIEEEELLTQVRSTRAQIAHSASCVVNLGASKHNYAHISANKCARSARGYILRRSRYLNIDH